MNVARETVEEVLQSLSDVMFPSDPDGPVAIDSRGYDGDTPLHVLAWRNDIERMELLIRAGADVNALGEMNETPLHIAMRQRNPAMARLLLASGARPDIRSEFGETPRDLASEGGKEFVELPGSK